MTNTARIGSAAEELVAQELKAQGYEILARNWKTRLCEIDIVASRGKVAYFIEVKYRSREGQGGGLEYITPKKLRQLRFAAELWVSGHNWPSDYGLMAASVKNEAERLILEEILEIS